MIKTQIDRLSELLGPGAVAFVDTVTLAAPFIVIGLAVWLLAVAGQWLIEWNERRCIERARRLRYRTASQRQIERDMQQLWRHR